MFVVYFVRTPDTTGVPVIGVSEHFKTLVYKNIVHKKVGNPIGKNAQTDRQPCPKAIIAPSYKTTDADQGVKQKEIIVPLPPTAVVFVVMVFVQFP
tara:strand:+ start:228 stop:515 length:288 start_codon:yes stop_codon:yes gene_type:complete